MTLEQYVDHVASGRNPPPITGKRLSWHNSYLPKPGSFGIGYARGIKTSGMLELYFRGEFYTARLCASKFERTKVMKDMLTRLGKLEGERWFIWKPDQK
jgi:hypothetical protein